MRTITFSYGLRPTSKPAESKASLPPTSFRYQSARPTSVFSTLTPIEYWREQLADLNPTLNIPFLKPQNAAFKKTIQTAPFELSSETVDQMRAFARSEVTTTFTVMLSIWQVLLARYSGEAEFMIGCTRPGTPSSVQDRPQMVRASAWGEDTFREIFHKTARHSSESASYRGPSVRELTGALAIDTPRHRHPIFQTAFIQRHSLSDRVSLAATVGEFAPCDLVLVWDETSARIRGRMEHPLGLIDRSISEKLPEQFRALALSCLSSPDTIIKELRLPSLSEAVAV